MGTAWWHVCGPDMKRFVQSEMWMRVGISSALCCARYLAIADGTTFGIKVLHKGLRPALARLDMHTVQCFAASNARHSDHVPTAGGVSSAAIETGPYSRWPDAGQQRQDRARHRLVGGLPSHGKRGLTSNGLAKHARRGRVAASSFILASAVVSARRSRTSSKAIDGAALNSLHSHWTAKRVSVCGEQWTCLSAPSHGYQLDRSAPTRHAPGQSLISRRCRYLFYATESTSLKSSLILDALEGLY